MKQNLKLVFPRHLIKEPVVFTMAKKHNVMPNISRARVTRDFGEMDLVLEGTEENLRKSIESLREQGVTV